MNIIRIDDDEYKNLMVNVIEGMYDHQRILYNSGEITLDPSTGFIRRHDRYYLVPNSMKTEIIGKHNYAKYRRTHDFKNGCISTINKDTFECECIKCPDKLPLSEWHK